MPIKGSIANFANGCERIGNGTDPLPASDADKRQFFSDLSGVLNKVLNKHNELDAANVELEKKIQAVKERQTKVIKALKEKEILPDTF